MACFFAALRIRLNRRLVAVRPSDRAMVKSIVRYAATEVDPGHQQRDLEIPHIPLRRFHPRGELV
jgi:hypothetical protein